VIASCVATQLIRRRDHGKAATRSELIDRIEELEEENAALSDKLSSITEILEDEDDGDD